VIGQQESRNPTFTRGSLIDALNGPWHLWAMNIYMVIVISHWVEHLLQAFQIWAMGWPRHEAGGALGLIFPWLVHSEWLHYAYAIVMLIGLFLLRPAYSGRARRWWDVSLGIQFWHHIEHGLLLIQALVGANLFGGPVRTSLLQLVFPRVELHLFYNAVVFVPMVIAMYYHLYPPKGEVSKSTCTCARHQPMKPATVASN
jgi:hypothetical protein